MDYKSNKENVLLMLKLCKSEFCDRVGNLVEQEAKTIAPVGTSEYDTHKGLLRRSITHESLPNNEGVAVGVTPDAPYALVIEKGLLNHKAQPFLEPAANNAAGQIEKIAEQLYKDKMGGD